MDEGGVVRGKNKERRNNVGIGGLQKWSKKEEGGKGERALQSIRPAYGVEGGKLILVHVLGNGRES